MTDTTREATLPNEPLRFAFLRPRWGIRFLYNGVEFAGPREHPFRYYRQSSAERQADHMTILHRCRFNRLDEGGTIQYEAARL